MVTCKENCLHYEACKATYKKLTGDSGTGGNAEYCKYFKDRSKFVDVSELQQNVIRPLTNRCAEYTKCQTCLACALEIRERCEHYKKAEQALKEREKK